MINEPDEDVSGYIANLLTGEDMSNEVDQPRIHTMTLRLPMEMASYLIVMAQNADRSRVEMGRLLVQAGIDSVLSRLPPEVAIDTREAAHERFLEMISEG